MSELAAVRDRGHHSAQAPRLAVPTGRGRSALPTTKENALQAEARSLEPELTQREPMQRLGETTELGSLLFRILTLQGWTVDTRPALGGGVIVTACRAGTVVRHHGATVADVATDVFTAASRLQEPSVRR